jgi:adenylate kinase
MPDTPASPVPAEERPAVRDLEVKDAQLIFNAVWTGIAREQGEENLRFPKEIFWLNGAPGAGKGTNTDFIMKYRDLTAAPIVVSDLLKSPEAERMKDAGMLVGDREVTDIVFRRLLDPQFQSGAVVDGYPRSKVQVECVKMLYHKLNSLRLKYRETLLAEHFKKPHFHIVVLFIDEGESVKRQLHRGRSIQAHNEKVRDTGVGELLELRATDLDEEAAHNRYRTFKEQTYPALKSLREVFFYHFINAQAPIPEVRERIHDELRYQSSLELDEATYDRLAGIPVASEIAQHARQDLVDRLDDYEARHSGLFARVVALVREKFIPIIERHAISGMSLINSEDPIFEEPLAMAMVIDIFSERGFHAVVDVHRIDIPDRVDPKTFKIENRTKRVYRFRVQFPSSVIRRGR